MKYKIFLGFIITEIVMLSLFYVSGLAVIKSRKQEVQEKRDIVGKLMLTDFSVWTEARYTRNPSQADLFSPFQDFPSSIDHFPAGSIIAPGNVNELTEIRPGAKLRVLKQAAGVGEDKEVFRPLIYSISNGGMDHGTP
jgi:hypothetical protein